MTDCELCYCIILDEQDLSVNKLNHTPCANEYNRRFNNSLCVKCGGDNDITINDTCHNCIKNNLNYQGYEGPK